VANQLESEQWKPYFTFLTAYLAIFTFFHFYGLSHKIFVFDYWALMLGVTVNDIPAILAVVSLGSLSNILLKRVIDVIGRKKSILLFPTISHVFNIISYYSPNLLTFIVIRMISWTFMINSSSLIISEEVPARYRSTVSGITMGVGMCAAILAAGLSIFFNLNPELWRASFIWVMVPGIVIIVGLGTQIKETRRFLEIKRDPNKKKVHLFSVFKKKYAKNIIFCTVIITCLNLLYLTIKTYFKPFLLTERGFIFNSELIGIIGMLSYFGSMVGYYTSGILGDKLGRKKTLYMASAIYFVGSILFLFTPNFITIFLGFILVNAFFAVLMVIGDILTVEFFHTGERAVGAGWIYWFASFIPIFGNFLITPLSTLFSWGMSFFMIGTVAIIVMCIALIFIPETKHRVLEEIYATEIEKGKA